MTGDEDPKLDIYKDLVYDHVIVLFKDNKYSWERVHTVNQDINYFVTLITAMKVKTGLQKRSRTRLLIVHFCTNFA